MRCGCWNYLWNRLRTLLPREPKCSDTPIEMQNTSTKHHSWKVFTNITSMYGYISWMNWHVFSPHRFSLWGELIVWRAYAPLVRNCVWIQCKIVPPCISIRGWYETQGCKRELLCSALLRTTHLNLYTIPNNCIGLAYKSSQTRLWQESVNVDILLFMNIPSKPMAFPTTCPGLLLFRRELELNLGWINHYARTYSKQYSALPIWNVKQIMWGGTHGIDIPILYLFCTFASSLVGMPPWHEYFFITWFWCLVIGGYVLMFESKPHSINHACNGRVACAINCFFFFFNLNICLKRLKTSLEARQ